MRKFAMETYRAEAGIAAELGGPMVVVHPSPLLLEKPTDLKARGEHEAPLRRSMEELAQGKELYLKWAAEVVAMGGSVSAEHGIGKLKFIHLWKFCIVLLNSPFISLELSLIVLGEGEI